jgi:hypothetical protein
VLAVLLAAANLAVPLARAGVPVAKGKPAAAAPTVDDLLKWLPADTETVLVARGPFTIPAGAPPVPEVIIEPAEVTPDGNDAPAADPSRKAEGSAPDGEGGAKADIPGTAAALEGMALGPIPTACDGAFHKILGGRTVVLAMEGARRFRLPRDIGLGPYEGCHIIVLKDNLGKARAEWTRALKAKATEEIRIGRHSAYLFQQTNHKDEWHIYLVQAWPNVLLCATDRTYRQQVLERSEHPTGPGALPADLPEWKHINPHIRYWAVRHYAKDAKQKAFASGCAFAFDPDCDKVARVNYVGVPLGMVVAVLGEWN